MSVDHFYQNINQMDPLMPSPVPMHLEELAVTLLQKSAILGSVLHPITRIGMLALFREMNCYYSNLIEGHEATPLDIQNALKQDFSQEPAKRALQLESVAHIYVQKLIEEKLHAHPETNICSAEFLCWIHHAFYSRLPEEFTIVSGTDGREEHVIAGELRNQAVRVGAHVPPHHMQLNLFLKRFSDAYTPSSLTPLLRVVAIAASHHRLAWMHPFLDGNGRVIRLFSDAYFTQTHLDGHGLWTMARGLARYRTRYMQALAVADSVRQGDLDGRGNLSQKGLVGFCEFFLETAVDRSQLKPEAIHVLHAVLLNGELSRGEATRASGMSERFGRDLLKILLKDELLVSSSPKGPVRLGFPLFAVEQYFPNLYRDPEEH